MCSTLDTVFTEAYRRPKVSTASHGAHDFDFVSIGQMALSILAARQDLLIQLDREALAGQAEILQQQSHRSVLIKLALFTIEQNVHGI
jgi:hypothetical protein